MARFGLKTLSTFAALLLWGALASGPAKADAGIGISFGYDGGYFSDPCDYYDYYDQPPPWGLPPDYCEYPVNFEPVYFGGSWYRGPIYYRWYGGGRMYWLNGGWRRDEWRGARPSSIRWSDRGGWNNTGRGGNGWGQSQSYNRGSGDSWNRGGGDRGNAANRFYQGNTGDWNRGSNRGGAPAYQGARDYPSGGYHGGGGHGGWSGGNNANNGGGRGGPGGGQRGEHGGRH